MISNKFRLVIIVRAVFLGATIFFFWYLFLQTELYVTTSIVGLSIFYQIYALIRYAEKTNQALTRFFSTIKYEDFSQSFSDPGLGSSFDELYEEFSHVMEAFQAARAEKEVNYRYLQTVVRHVGVGLICYTQQGKVEIFNTAAKRLLNLGHLQHIDSLSDGHRELADALSGMKSGEKALVKIRNNGEVLQLSLYATTFKLRDDFYTLVSMQNIGGELEEREIEAWQNITRVLAHEIMNSITPISSLATTVQSSLSDFHFENAPHDEEFLETIEDIRSALQTIEKRSAGLLRFVNVYRDLAKIPKPDFQLCRVQELLERIHQLMSHRLQRSDIHFTIDVRPPTLTVTADRELIEQVLINLVTNAIQALEKQPDAHIILSGSLDDRGRVLIQIEDNGPGMKPDVLEKIFVPFFTTKADGTGIGLSFSRQIMHRHNGTISIRSEVGEGTVATLRF
ncbi:MAG TPA: ATP-binding protein [bacterium]|nr:ATP-binding protein [bacterium]